MATSKRKVIGVIGTAVLVLAFLPGYQKKTSSDAGGAKTDRTSMRLGLPFSPLVSVERTWVETPAGTPGRTLPSFRQSAGVHILSLSIGLLSLGLALVTWRDRRRGTAGG